MIRFPGYISEPNIGEDQALQGYAVLSIAPRGKFRSSDVISSGFPGLMIQGIESRETYIYRGLYVDALRAVDFALVRPEIDSGRIGIMGNSQEGGLALMSAGLHPEVACVSVGAPFLTGMMAATSLTHSSPYEEINEYLRCFPNRRSLVAETLSYFDCRFSCL